MFANARITIQNAVFNVLVHLPLDRVPPLDLVDLCRNLEFIEIGWAAYEESPLGLPEIKSEIRFEKANAEKEIKNNLKNNLKSSTRNDFLYSRC